MRSIGVFIGTVALVMSCGVVTGCSEVRASSDSFGVREVPVSSTIVETVVDAPVQDRLMKEDLERQNATAVALAKAESEREARQQLEEQLRAAQAERGRMVAEAAHREAVYRQVAVQPVTQSRTQSEAQRQYEQEERDRQARIRAAQQSMAQSYFIN